VRLAPLVLAALVACAPPAAERPASPAASSPPTAQATAGTAVGAAAPAVTVVPADPGEELRRTSFARSGWKTDLARRTIDLAEITPGGPPRDGIPPIDRPTFQSVQPAGAWLAALEPVVSVRLNGEARAYPLQVLTWHEIVNDEVGGVPVAVTFCFRGRTDGRLPPMERVVALESAGGPVAYPFSVLKERRVVQEPGVVVFYQPGTASALDQAQIARSKEVGAAAVYRPEVDGRALIFAWREGGFVDAETGSRWTLLGTCAGGPLAGKRLEPIPHANPFWFAWAAFRPETRIVG